MNFEIPSFMMLTFAEHSIWQWLALCLSFIVFVLGRFFLRALFSVIIHFSKFSPTAWDEHLFLFVKKECSGAFAWIIIYLYVAALDFSQATMEYLAIIVKLGIAWNLYKILYKLTNFIPQACSLLQRISDIHIDPLLIPMIEKTIKVLVVTLVPLVMLQNLGVNVGSILAGLGLGGLAIALAAKDTAANLFGSLMIMLDKPFAVGDWVVIGKEEGTVVDIGLRSTRIRSFYDSVISIPNADVINSHVDNMGKRQFRRIKTVIGVEYSTDPTILEEFITKIKDYLIEHPQVTTDNEPHVVLSQLSDSSLDILLYFFLQVQDWKEELETRQSIFIHILEIARTMGVGFAFPTRSVYLSHVQSLEPSEQG